MHSDHDWQLSAGCAGHEDRVSVKCAREAGHWLALFRHHCRIGSGPREPAAVYENDFPLSQRWCRTVVIALCILQACICGQSPGAMRAARGHCCICRQVRDPSRLCIYTCSCGQCRSCQRRLRPPLLDAACCMEWCAATLSDGMIVVAAGYSSQCTVG
jgi:hypothetical protein